MNLIKITNEEVLKNIRDKRIVDECEEQKGSGIRTHIKIRRYILEAELGKKLGMPRKESFPKNNEVYGLSGEGNGKPPL